MWNSTIATLLWSMVCGLTFLTCSLQTSCKASEAEIARIKTYQELVIQYTTAFKNTSSTIIWMRFNHPIDPARLEFWPDKCAWDLEKVSTLEYPKREELAAAIFAVGKTMFKQAYMLRVTVTANQPSLRVDSTTIELHPKSLKKRFTYPRSAVFQDGQIAVLREEHPKRGKPAFSIQYPKVTDFHEIDTTILLPCTLDLEDFQKMTPEAYENFWLMDTPTHVTLVFEVVERNDKQNYQSKNEWIIDKKSMFPVENIDDYEEKITRIRALSLAKFKSGNDKLWMPQATIREERDGVGILIVTGDVDFEKNVPPEFFKLKIPENAVDVSKPAEKKN